MAAQPKPQVGLGIVQCLICHEARLVLHAFVIANERMLIRPRPTPQSIKSY